MNPYNNSIERSYQVIGYTKSADKWKWNNFTCNNSKCWGSEKRFLEIQRIDFRWLLNFYNDIDVEINGKETKSKKTIERLYIR